MKERIVLLAIFVTVATMSFSAGQVTGSKPSVRPGSVSDHDKIEKLNQEVGDLQDQLAALSQKYASHTHQLRTSMIRMPRFISCDIQSIQNKNVCHQIGDDQVSVMFAPNNDAMVTAAPAP
jgi:hypothetical protein